MITALVPVYPHRPPWIKRNSMWIALSVHDAAYLRMRDDLRRAILLAPTEVQRTKAVQVFQNYVRREIRWYALHELEPPRHGLRPKQVPVSRQRRRRGVAHHSCRHGHPLTEKNRYVDRKGFVRCRTCLNGGKTAQRVWTHMRHLRLRGRPLETLPLEQLHLIVSLFGRWLAQQ